jgi:hypothetical protein
LYPFLVIAEFVPTFFVRTSIWSIWLAANIHKKASEHSRCHRSHHATAAAAEPLVHLAAPEVHHTATQTATPVRVWVLCMAVPFFPACLRCPLLKECARG